MKAYCEKCQKLTDMKETKEVSLKQDLKAVEGKCAICGTKVYAVPPLAKPE